MSTLKDYLDPATLQQLQDAFSAAAQVPIRICQPDEAAPGPESITPHEADGQGRFAAPIRLGAEVLGRVVLDAAGPGREEQKPGYLQLLADVIAGLCAGRKELRARVEELGTLYRLTAEFAGRRDLQEILETVAQTVVASLKAKACSIRLLSEDRTELVIKAVANLSEAYLDKGPILLSESRIDQQVLSTGKCVYIADSRTDPRVLYPAEASREGIVSALCAPLVYKGRAEGAIRVYMASRHEFDWFEVSLLEAIAAQAAAAIVNARLYHQAIRSANMSRAMAMAGEVQRRMIPAKPPEVPGFQIAAVYDPCFELGGDFYDFIHLPRENLGLAVCDVIGKGVRASLLMASVRASLRAHAINVYDMSEVLGKVNRDLCTDTLTSDFATLFYGVLDVKTRRLTYANAGHVPPLLFRDDNCRALSAGGGVLGIDPQARWGRDVLVLSSGDVVLAYTDGLSEAMNFEDEPFARRRVEQAALAAIRAGQDAEGIVQHVLWEMRRFTGLQTRLDDLTLIAIKVL